MRPVLFDRYALVTYDIQRIAQKFVIYRCDRQVTAKFSLKCFHQNGLHPMGGSWGGFPHVGGPWSPRGVVGAPHVGG